MTTANNIGGQESKASTFQWWMVSNLGIGAGFAAFVVLLIPPYITGITNAADAGVIMAIIALSAVLGPVLGGFADRYRAHRLVLVGGIFLMAFGFFFFGWAAFSNGFFSIDAILIGVGVASVGAVAPVYVIGAGLDQELQAKRLTALSLVIPIGTVVGGAIMSAAVTAGLSYPDRFFIAGGMMALVGLVTWLSSGQPTKQLLAAMDAKAQQSANQTQTEAKPESLGLGRILLSTFGIFLLVMVCSEFAANGVNNQISNILPNVFGISEATTSGLISLTGVFNIGLFFVAGRWMARSSIMGPFLLSHLARFVGALGMAFLGMMSDNAPLIMTAFFMQVLYQGLPFLLPTQAVGAVRFSSLLPGAASGFVFGAAAGGAFLGSVVGGILADSVGFNAINWMAAVTAGLAVVMTLVSLVPADRKIRKEEEAAPEEM